MTDRCPALAGAATAFLILFCLAASAGETDKKSEQNDLSRLLPYMDLATDEELKKDFVRLEFKPFGDPRMEMFFLVPKDWESKKLRVTKDDLARDRQKSVVLALVVSPDEKARIEVSYVRVSGSVDLETWARSHMQLNGVEPLAAQLGKFTGREVFDSVFETPGGMTVRLTFSQHRDRIVLFAGSCGKKTYPDFARVLGLATTSFAMAK